MVLHTGAPSLFPPNVFLMERAMFYRDHTEQLCYDDGEQDWFVNEQTGDMTVADWFWYLV